MKVKAIILAGGEGTRLATLTAKRAKPAVPFAGKYRIIDFPLSTCVNSGIFDVLILTQYRPHSLNDHIERGRPWDLDRSFTGGVQILQPYKGRYDTDWYSGTADAVTQNLNFVRRGRPDYVLILSGDHIYEMDYDVLIQYHRDKKAAATICTITVPLDEASRYGIVDVNDDYSVRSFIEKPANPPGNLANMGVYLFSYPVLERMLKEDHQIVGSNHDFGKDILPRMVEEGMGVYAYPYGGYWIDVGTVEAYWEAHMDLLAAPPSINLNDRTWIIHTKSEERPPVMIHESATVRDSLLTDGTVVSDSARVERSVLSPGVFVGPNAVVRESVILTDTYIEAGAVVERCIVDKIAVIGHNAHVGSIPQMGELGITCIGKNAHVPAGYTVGHGSVLGTDLRMEDFQQFADKIVPSGTKLGFTNRKR
ncbi:MAG: glucose-1-phosphate adenylyltransferase [Anaerolineae bacterium]|nr:glucose-1-phosphate adenylyltransferase [Anaerolineae bacterium]